MSRFIELCALTTERCSLPYYFVRSTTSLATAQSLGACKPAAQYLDELVDRSDGSIN